VQLNWKQYFNHILSVTPYRVNESEPIIVKEPEFLRQLSRIVLQMLSTTEGRRYSHFIVFVSSGKRDRSQKAWALILTGSWRCAKIHFRV